MEEEGKGAEGELEEVGVAFAAVEGEKGLREGDFGWRKGGTGGRSVCFGIVVVFLEGCGVAGVGTTFVAN